ncbi:MAG: nucleotidyltransferase family protein [Oliverpabstia sp.]
MKIAGIIAEYNPFHTGHAYHIQKTREITGADFIIVVMSGDFIQRGGPAFLSKHHRTKMALLGGADLVFELPATHSCQSAEHFARSGVELLNGLGCVDYLSFGSELGDICPFLTIGNLLATEPEVFRQLLKENLKTGLSFPAARARALEEYLCTESFCPESLPDWSADYSVSEDLLKNPNNILGIEYCKALYRTRSQIQPVTVRREGNGYHETSLGSDLPSASAIRNLCSDKQKDDLLASCFPSEIFSLMKSEDWFSHTLEEQDFSLLIRWLLMASDIKKLTVFQDINEDLARRILNVRDQYENFSQFVSLIKTKDMTYTRICRALFHAILDIREIPELSYARLLGFRRSASPVMHEIKKRGELPLLTKLADSSRLLDKKSLALLKQNTRISNLYETVLSEKTQKPFIHEYSKPVVIV